jgi:hypothetical protein
MWTGIILFKSQAAVSPEHDKELSVSMKGAKFLD